MGLFVFSMWGRRILSSWIPEMVTGQKTEKHGSQRCREGQDKEEYGDVLDLVSVKGKGYLKKVNP